MLALSFFATHVAVAASVSQFVVNLDLPPIQRFGDIAEHYRDDLVAILTDLKTHVYKSINAIGRKEWLSALEYDKEYQEELTGMAQILDHKAVTYDLLVFWNAIYEMDSPTFCTGILAAMPDGTVVHGRNMDFPYTFNVGHGWAGSSVAELSALTHDVTFTKYGKPLMRSTSWPGHIGIHSGMGLGLPGKWSIQVNGRPKSDSYAGNLRGAKNGGQPYSLVVRSTMSVEPDYDKAMGLLYASNLAAPCYMVMAGDRAFQGAILTLDRNGQHEFGTPPVQRLNPNMGVWFLVETNDDLNAMASDVRRPVVAGQLDMHTMEDVSARFMINILRTPPAFNTATSFTSVYLPTRGEAYSFIPNEEPTLPNEPGAQSVTNSSAWRRFLAPWPTKPPHRGLPRTASWLNPAMGMESRMEDTARGMAKKMVDGAAAGISAAAAGISAKMIDGVAARMFRAAAEEELATEPP